MCTLEQRGRVFVLTLTGADEHRLNPTLLDSIQSALHRVRSSSTPSSALVTTAEGKFFSNGFDLSWAADSDDRKILLGTKLKQIVSDLFSLPMPTVAAVTGHASAAGFLLALSHDYVVMRKDRGFLYMSELDIGLMIPDYFMAVLREKIPAAGARREVVLRAGKLTAVRAAEMGIVDKAYNSAAETVEGGVRLGEELAGRGWDGELYARTRKASYPEACLVLGLVNFRPKL
ncbi:enoyl-CoA delta isomerase 2, peroxisomal-like protein [Cinnamomum micranthum f. kanehirae]|uniref:Delta(3)-Delta(2)-enoyl-CoA isomerase n=1 Tax=Cinnamomum micranthum f. kanehirae TaxID=337451 RepID=A0A3S3NXR1_9MAGN|nr:enoyl-CoA delta isomerase 2, peroxisomal-like protein [Cinnamomum micranthum f. kanehirae]